MLIICNCSIDIQLGDMIKNLQLQKHLWVVCLRLFERSPDLNRFPGALAKDLIEVKADGLLLDETFHLGLHGGREDPHQSLGRKPVLGALLVVTLGHVGEHEMCGLVDVMDDLSKVLLEVARSKFLKVGQSSGRNVTLPLQVSLARINQSPQLGVLLHEGSEGPGELQLVSGDGSLATRQGQSSLLLVSLWSWPPRPS